MARINTYGLDNTPSLSDKWIGTDSETTETKNFTVSSIVELINNNSLIDQFDGTIYEFKSMTSEGATPTGILCLQADNVLTTSFSAINNIFISKVHGSGDDVSVYLQDMLNNNIKINQQGNLNAYGVYEVTNIQAYSSNTNFLQFTVRFLSGSGSLTANERYFLSNYQSVTDADFSDNSVTEFSDVSDAGSGRIITDPERVIVTNALVHNDVVNNTSSTSSDLPLSANQGRILQEAINSINTLLTSDNVDLDTLQEVVDYIETNRSTLNALSISNISGLQNALNNKQDTETGKGLSTNDFTQALLNKLNGIADGAEVNVQTDWNGSGDAAILNKPTNFIFTTSSVTDLNDVSNAGSGYIITVSERNKLTNIAANAEVNVQSDWNESDSSSDAFIQNKPTLSGNTTYDLTVAQSGDDAVITLEGSDNIDDDVTLAAGNHIDITVNSGTATIDADLTTGAVADGATTLVTGDHVFDYANPKFARKDQAETFSNNVTIQGNLTVSGTTTTVNSNQLNIADNIITLNSDLLSNVAPSQNAGIEVNRGSSSTVSIRWNEGNGNWEFTNDGTTYQSINADHPINDLTDVNITSLTNDQVLRYNSTTSKWENTTLSYIDGTATAGTLPKMQDSDTITDSSISESGQVVDIDTTGAIKVPDGGTSARPTAAAGMFRYNTDTGKFEGYTTEWGDIGGASENIINITVAQVSGSNKFHIDGTAQTSLILIPGQKYIIDQSDSSNAGHPIKFSTTEDGTHGSGTEYTTGVTVTGTPGSTGAKTEITLEQDSPVLYYYCANHSGMGGKVQNLRASGAAVVERRTYSPDGSSLTFPMGQSITNENNVFVYIDGVYQNKSTFTVSGSDLVFGTGNEPPSGTELEIISYASLQATDGSSMFTDVFTGNGSTTAFTLSSQPASKDHTLVYIQGVYQEKEHYSLSGSTITFTTAPQNTYSVEIISITSALTVSDVGQIQNNTFTGNGTTTDFTLSLAPTNETHTLVYINGVYQEKSTYSVSGTTLSFSTAPSNGDSIEVESRKNLAPSSITFSDVDSDLFSGTGSQTSFTLVNGSPGAKKDTMVYINGVYQNKSTYSLTSGDIVFNTAPSNNDEVEVVSISQVVSATTGVTSVNGASGDVEIETRKYDVEVISADANAEAYHVYVFTATLTLTLPASPEVGQWIKISNRSGVDTCVLGANTNKIMGATTDLTLDTASASFELVYSGTAQGWVIIGQ